MFIYKVPSLPGNPRAGRSGVRHFKYIFEGERVGEGGFHSTLCASGTGPTSVGAAPESRGSGFDGCIMRVACASPIVAAAPSGGSR